ncbi:MAG TPA: ABC transporter ATP-binding protein [Solirubrobacteraceae bacterium]|nr:ABC transporter ATP-binding protein [Solirubrobacteraceae bacterium]
MGSAAIAVQDLRIELSDTHDDIVDEVTLRLAPGEVLGLVGESGSGKTTVGLAMLGHQRRGATVAGGQVQVGELDMLSLNAGQRRSARGRLVSYVPQDPSASLNPARRIGVQLLEALRVHDWGGGEPARRTRVTAMLADVSLPQDPPFLARYPHELSGGQQQRVALAMAFACEPAVVVLDEPTTGLDVTTQAHVLRTVRRMTREGGTAALYVSHDLSVVASFADRVAVMYAGRLVEQGPTDELFRCAAHPYTRLLLAAVPRLDSARTLSAIPGRAPSPGRRPPGCPFAPRCDLRIDACERELPAPEPVGPEHEARCIRIAQSRALAPATKVNVTGGEPEPTGTALSVTGLSAAYGGHEVVHDVSLAVGPRECVALVGESGSGKTTIARSISGLHAQWRGEVRVGDELLSHGVGGRSRQAKREIQYVFQNPYGSLNPRRNVGQAVARPLTLLDVPRREVTRRVHEMLERVALPATYAERYPDQLSGGERQRVAIARALICEPRVLLCDEVTSALDVSVQAAIVTLLGDIQRDVGLSILFVTHNLPLVRSIAQRVIVMRDGRVVETGPTADVLEHPADAYTQRLIADAPRIDEPAPTAAEPA